MYLSRSQVRVLTHEKYAVTLMNQEFNGDGRYVSNGRKVLYWKKDQSHWKIVREVFDNRLLQPVVFSSEELERLSSHSLEGHKHLKLSGKSTL
jgi:hypothetical protein